MPFDHGIHVYDQTEKKMATAEDVFYIFWNPRVRSLGIIRLKTPPKLYTRKESD